ncbi:MAG: hypothetical protein ACI4NG_03935 [Candidatus Gallimonas sp.]
MREKEKDERKRYSELQIDVMLLPDVVLASGGGDGDDPFTDDVYIDVPSY